MFKKTKQRFKKIEIDDDKKDVEFERGDFLAIAIALSYYMIPALIGVFALMGFLTWFIFR